MPGGTGFGKKFRDLRRLLQKTGDNEELKKTLESKIKDIEVEQIEHRELEKRKKHEQKYQLVKFVERKKLTRMIERVMKQLQKSEGPKSIALETQLDQLKDDLTYVM
jgi:hypothetical protein